MPFDALLDFDIVGLHLGAAVHEQMRERAQALGRTLNVRLQVRGFIIFDFLERYAAATSVEQVLPLVRDAEQVKERMARLWKPWGTDPMLAAGEIDAVIVGADRIAALHREERPGLSPEPDRHTRPCGLLLRGEPFVVRM